MKTLDVIFGLHFYQPPTQRPEVIEKITRECYQPLPEVLAQTPCHFVVDIAGALITQLNRYNPAVLAEFRKLIEEILKAGAPQQQERGKELIRQLQQ